ncbi:Acyl-homoserine-lactone synthase [Actinidia chinensis var. chinensis]|uniref:Acyl-homoserine-lactone synthase n=1 Tax=Actinidia chinensis var. chinensis TaxID=1590841 RepID=A0A2R6QUA8_ACTCC|nr:Acyl-homoserine-lactone synthase [Actinidia chinensis var. chinensis]
MKSGLGAAIYSILTAQHRRSISEAISAKPSLTFSNRNGCANSLQSQGIESLKRSLHSSSDDEDDFSELGAPVQQGVGKQLKLVTQKPEPYGKMDPVKKVFSGRSLPAEYGLSLSKLRTALTALRSENRNNSSRNRVDTKNISHIPKSRSITIQEVPSTVGLPQLIEAMSVFGVISRASMRTVPYGLDCCDVEFECVESSRRAVSVGGITVRNRHLPICPLLVPEAATIRIKNISDETAEAAIHSICMSFGSLEGLSRTREDAIDVLYNVKDNLELQIILKRLNDTVTGDRRWAAHLLNRDTRTNNEETKDKLGFQIISVLAELKRQDCTRKIDMEDYEYLHLSILHLEETPSFGNPSY